MKGLHKITFILLIIGGLNWGLQALGWNLVDSLLGSWPQVVMIVYLLVGLSAIYEIISHKSLCRNCSPMGGGQM